MTLALMKVKKFFVHYVGGTDFHIAKALLRYSGCGRKCPFPVYIQRMRTVSGVPSDVKRFMSAMRI